MTTTGTPWSSTDVRRAVAAHFTDRGMGPDVLSPDDFTRLVDEGAAGVLRFERFRLTRIARTARPRSLVGVAS
jgi:hypothetical protein